MGNRKDFNVSNKKGILVLVIIGDREIRFLETEVKSRDKIINKKAAPPLLIINFYNFIEKLINKLKRLLHWPFIMMASRLTGIAATGIADNTLGLSWHDSHWIPILNSSNVLDYFSQASNPFFDRTCNNEIAKMQRLSPDQLQNMVGLEYVLLHVQEPILYVIRKQHRHSSQQVTPLADYYIIAGIVYQAPDLASVLNSRLLSAVHHLQSSFDESSGFSRYHPSKGYSWDFKTQRNTTIDKEKPAEKEKPKEEPSSVFQRKRVDMLLGELIKKFPLPIPPQPKAVPAVPIKAENENGAQDNKEIKIEPKQENKIKPPPEKKPRVN